ncbi:PTS N-acetylgalactosamine transporter subunit IIB [Enterobacter sp. RHB15-C17]|jgi:PTS system galactosamine-specific IIB component|uniref:PTS N-acetylgalactosamine transporter subunit IIB n=1 Tax=Lelliottia nimipressuralis TaxID=69220 RepID=A0ABD4K4B0_9ENTR|nr:MULTISPECIES: PTS galactosamine transporter subunit IIB [Lelliottia]MDH6631148.1 PTS system galactosamine-specific IIB component [Lelliottia amnigena]PKA30492.1 PTS N-acetylgalactosamine transporter subunit IIB [Cedecea lapagei]QMM54352.1 PTS N-acetylgalactosamine transporter subunit IIB [Enterobacter sp. RHB15-C17]MBF4176702.1 PTS N-acetylgalactosamine transporter subunit IIB [Lelliottia nimipressuralis]MCY1696517.1 PTS galactosamine transporter subunit IIB [Lelliottia sp. SL45]
MSSPNILLTRIDNRLVHGQVGVTWTSTIGANLLIVVDDEVAKDEIQQKLMGITADTYGFGIRFFSIEKTIAIIEKAAPHQKIFLICRTPDIVRKLIEGGVPLKDVNVGNMHFSEGKRQISSKVYVDEQDLDDLRFIKHSGVNLFIQDVPGDAKEGIPD